MQVHNNYHKIHLSAIINIFKYSSNSYIAYVNYNNNKAPSKISPVFSSGLLLEKQSKRHKEKDTTK